MELARHSAESIIPRRYYTLLSELLNWASAVRFLGWSQARTLRKAQRTPRRSLDQALRVVKSPNLRFPLHLRPGTSDVHEFIYTVVRETYKSYLPQSEVKFILDAGANIGDSAAWFLSRFPEAKVVAVEPDPDNFSILQMNISPYGARSLPVQAAVWPKSAQLSLREDGAKDAVNVLESDQGNCLGLTIPELMKKYEFPRLDILKCDIEGAEQALFSIDSDDWLSTTRMIVIETHGPECLRAVVDATARHGFFHREYRNLHVFEMQVNTL